VLKIEQHLNIDYIFDHQMSLCKGKCWYSNNCLQFLKHAVPLVLAIDIDSIQNRLLKVCYVPATSACVNKLLFAAAINSTNEANKASSTRC
jgi:hypothetical protein